VAGIREFADRVGGARRGHTHFRHAKRSPKYALPARTSCCSAYSKVTLGRISCTAPDTCVPGKRQIAAGSRRSLVEAYPSLSLVEGGFNLDDRVVDHKRRDGSTLCPWCGPIFVQFITATRRLVQETGNGFHRLHPARFDCGRHTLSCWGEFEWRWPS
jgi:hypothetical protein